jgi:hypothetical protein
VIAASFQFRQYRSDSEFEQLDSKIMEFCEHIAGFEHKKKWLSPDGDSINVVYYFANRESLTELMRFEPHQEAKRRNQEWYSEYLVEIYEITGSYSSKN